MFNSLVPNGDVYLSSINVLLLDNGHAIPLRIGGEKEIDWNQKHHADSSMNTSYDDDDEQIDLWRTIAFFLIRL